MDDAISRQVLDLWNRYRPTIAVDAIEYDRELKRILSTNLASLGTDAISRQQAIDALEKWLHGLFGITEADGTATIFKTIRRLPPIQPADNLQELADEIASFKRHVKSENSDYLTGYLCALSVVEGMIADMREVTNGN